MQCNILLSGQDNRVLPGEFDFVLPETNWISAGLTLLLALGSRVAKQQGMNHERFALFVSLHHSVV